MKTRTQTQNKELHRIISLLGLEDQKPQLAHQASAGRTERTSELTVEECRDLIHALKDGTRMPTGESEGQKANRLRRKVLSICHQLGWYKRDGDGNLIMDKKGKPSLDWQRIDKFCMERGKFKKRLQKHNSKELQKLIAQFNELLLNYTKQWTK